MEKNIKKNQNGKVISPLNSPKTVQCYECSSSFPLIFVVPKWDYSSKNNWDYWTEDPNDKGKYKCNSCLLDLYYNHKQDYWKLVSSPKKRQQMRTYVYDRTIT